MKKLFTFVFILTTSFSLFAGSGIYETYMSTSLNGGGQSYWGTGGGNPAFGSSSLGTITSNSNTLFMKLHGMNSWNDNGCAVQTATMKIRVYLSSATPPSFTNVNLTYQNESGNNKFWNNNSAGTDINLLANCTVAGTYNVDVQFDYTNNGTNCSSPTTTSIATATFVTTVVLPINLSQFEVKNQNKVNFLSWTTETESNASHFEVEKSTNGTSWSKMKDVKAFGNSVRRQVYDFTDETPNKGINYYRLKMVDRDGSFDYSKVVSANFNGGGKVNIFPNPAQDVLSIAVSDDVKEATVEIFNINGQAQMRNILNGNQLNISDLTAGLYFIQVSDENGQVISREKLMKK